MASGECCWEEAITRAVQGAVWSVLTDRGPLHLISIPPLWMRSVRY